MTRRLPVYLLLDTSGSMRGEPIQAVDNGLRVMFSALRQDPFALETVHASLITFDLEVRELFPLTPLSEVQMPSLTVPQSGATMLGAALHLLADRVEKDVRKTSLSQKGDWRPIVFLMTDGAPSDILAYQEALPRLKALNLGKLVVCAAGPKARPDSLKELPDATVVALDNLSAADIAGFFEWVSSSVSAGSLNPGSDAPRELEPPPATIEI